MRSSDSGGVETPDVIGEKYIRTLDALSRADPALSGWVIWEDHTTLDQLVAWVEDGEKEPAPIRPVPIEEARKAMTALVETNVYLDEWGEEHPDHGFTIIAVNRYNKTPRGVSVTVHAGSKHKENDWSVDFGDGGLAPPDPSLINFPMMDGIFRTMISTWPTPWARLRGSTSDSELRPAFIGWTSVETFRHEITWIGYLSAALAPGFEPPPDLISERMPDGGVLMLSARGRPDPANAEEMRRSALLTEIMDQYFPDRILG
jgi:hypothetical protein